MKFLRKLLNLVMISVIALSLSACSNTETEDIKEKPAEITLSTEEESAALETIKYMCGDTAYDNAKFKLVTELQEDFNKYNNVLKLIVIKDKTEVETYYRLNGGGDTIDDSIKKSLVLDTAISAVDNDKINKFDRIVAVIYDSEEDYNNDDSYAVDTLEID